MLYYQLDHFSGNHLFQLSLPPRNREARRAAILRKYEDPSVWETKPEELVIRREQGYAAIEKKMKENHINLCSVQAKEVIGDVEMLQNLRYDMHRT